VKGLPSGTVTFLFTDVEGSTRLLEAIGAEAYAASLAGCRQVLRHASAGHKGVEVDTQGDAFFAAFASAPEALLAALEAQEKLAEGRVRVRMGLHTGTPLVTDEGYVGSDVHRAARIAAAASGGQILLSQSTRDLVDAELRDLGLHRLKDLDNPERIFQFGRGTFPPLKSLHLLSLPVATTRFVGRERELSEVVQILRVSDARLLTLTGPGGSGKTRLAVEAARHLSPDFPDGVHWVSFAWLREPRLVLPSIAAALGTESELAEHLAEKRLLLVLDNLEHLLEAADDLAGLVQACPRISFLLTSRQRLRLGSEHVYDVPVLSQQDAVSLFVERATAAGLRVIDDGVVAAICRKLDRLPLAIELAAARVNVLPLEAILARLENHLPALAEGPRDAPERQRTLRAAIAWSYDLLSACERQSFARLGVFAGGWTLAAATHICDVGLETLSSLIDKSLVRRIDDRYSMLETIREYALERLADSGEGDQLRRAHADWYSRYAREAGGIREREREIDNFRAALGFLLETHDVNAALGLAAALDHVWRRTRHLPEGRRWLEQGLSAGDATPATRARALAVLGWLVMDQGDFSEATLLLQTSLRIARDTHDGRIAATALGRLGMLYTQTGEYKAAHASLEEALALYAVAGSARGRSFVFNSLAILAAFEDDFVAARRWLEDDLKLAREIGSRPHIAVANANLGFDAVLRRDYDSAEEFLREALALTRDEGDLARAPVVTTLGRLEIGRGQFAAARVYLAEALETYAASGARARCAECFEGFARIALAWKDAPRAAQLLGATAAIRDRSGVRLSPREQQVFDEAVEALDFTGNRDLQAAWRRGEEMALDDLVGYSLASDDVEASPNAAALAHATEPQRAWRRCFRRMRYRRLGDAGAQRPR
jgi:predicted ATPase/Tfp pilus assembly protein PilF